MKNLGSLLGLLAITSLTAACPGGQPPQDTALVESARALEASAARIGEVLDATPGAEIQTDPQLFAAVRVQGIALGLASQARKGSERAKSLDTEPSLALEDQTAVMFTVLLESARAAQSELQTQIDALAEANDRKKALREAMQGMKTEISALADAALAVHGDAVTRPEYIEATKVSVPESRNEITVVTPGPAQAVSVHHAGEGSLNFSVTCQVSSRTSKVIVTLRDLATGAAVVTGELDANATTYRSPDNLLPAGPYSLAIEAVYKPLDRFRGGALCNVALARMSVVTTQEPGFTREQLERHDTLKGQFRQEISEALSEVAGAMSAGEIPTQVGYQLQDFLVKRKNSVSPAYGIDSAREEKERQREELDSLSQLGEIESLRLQLAMDRMSELMRTISGMLQKVSDTGQAMVDNLK